MDFDFIMPNFPCLYLSFLGRNALPHKDSRYARVQQSCGDGKLVPESQAMVHLNLNGQSQGVQEVIHTSTRCS